MLYLIGIVLNYIEDKQTQVVHVEVQRTEDLSLSFIDVGQGNSTLIIAKEWVGLIDFGNKEEKLYEGLTYNNVQHIDYVFVTHPDLDHYGAWETLVDNGFIDSNTVFYQPVFYFDEEDTGEQYREMLDYFEENGISVKGINTENQDDILEKEIADSLDLVWPNPEYSGIINGKNNNSLVFIINGDNRAFLSGDIENEVEKYLYETYNLPICEIFLAPHHGSEYSSAPALLNKLKFKIAVVSVGNNSYGHPHDNTITRLNYITEKYNGKENIFRTDVNGTINISLDTLETTSVR